jgi:hypothetical protein
MFIYWVEQPKAKQADLNAQQLKYIEEIEKLPYQKRIHGVPGVGLENTFGSVGNVGAQAEAGTAYRLNKLAEKYDTLHVYNGIHFKGQEWDIDHAVIMGNTIVLIDSKRWQNKKTYTLHKSTKDYGKLIALRNGSTFSGGTLSMPLMVEKVKKHFPHHRVLSVISVEASGSDFTENLNETKTGFCRSDHLIDRLEQSLSEVDPSLNRSAIFRFAGYVVNRNKLS